MKGNVIELLPTTILNMKFLRTNKNIVLCSSSMQQEYATKEDFKNEANINGELLKDI